MHPNNSHIIGRARLEHFCQCRHGNSRAVETKMEVGACAPAMRSKPSFTLISVNINAEEKYPDCVCTCVCTCVRVCSRMTPPLPNAQHSTAAHLRFFSLILCIHERLVKKGSSGCRRRRKMRRRNRSSANAAPPLASGKQTFLSSTRLGHVHKLKGGPAPY